MEKNDWWHSKENSLIKREQLKLHQRKEYDVPDLKPHKSRYDKKGFRKKPVYHIWNQSKENSIKQAIKIEWITGKGKNSKYPKKKQSVTL